MRILELRQEMMTAQGESFDLTEFYNIALGSGAMPLELLTEVIEGGITGE
jgi:uncharacterized protein (DUF885 family)